MNRSHRFAPQPVKLQAVQLNPLPIELFKKLTTALNARLKRLWLNLADWVSNASEPQVWQKRDRQGNITTWYVYDPNLGQTICFGSELEVRLWFEQRYV